MRAASSAGGEAAPLPATERAGEGVRFAPGVSTAGRPYRNRVSPFGEIFADPARGLWLGNRGRLHDGGRTILRPWQARRWIICRLEFRGRHREVMSPWTWTHLFFLDEATALAAGHRPCGECRHADYRRFRQLWAALHPSDAAGADAIDLRLHAERVLGRSGKRVEPAELAGLPDGAFVAQDSRPWLVRDRLLLEWSPAGYISSRPRPRRAVLDLLTPPSVVAVIRAGYAAQVHPTAGAFS